MKQKRTIPPEQREKIRQSLLGKPKNEKTRKALLYWATGERNVNWKGGVMKDPIYVSWLRHQNRRNRKYALGSHSYGEWETLKAQYDWRCPCCKKGEPEIALHVDHIIPLSRGGSDNIENIQPLCKSCNSRKNTKTIKYDITN